MPADLPDPKTAARYRRAVTWLCLPAKAHGRRANAFPMACGDGQVRTLLVHGRFVAEHMVAGVERLLLPVLRKPSVLIVDNANFHRCALVRAKRKEGSKRLRVMFLPPYSPHLNPVERLWRRVKYRLLGPRAYETYETLCQGLEQVFGGMGAEYRFTFV